MLLATVQETVAGVPFMVRAHEAPLMSISVGKLILMADELDNVWEELKEKT